MSVTLGKNGVASGCLYYAWSITGAGTYGLSMWVSALDLFFPANPAWGVAGLGNTDGGENRAIRLQYVASNFMGLWADGNTSDNPCYDATPQFPTGYKNVWVHVGIEFQVNASRETQYRALYVDGVRTDDNDAATTAWGDWPNRLAIGAMFYSGSFVNRVYGLRFAEAAIWETEAFSDYMTQAGVNLQTHKPNRPEFATGLVEYWPLLSGPGTGIPGGKVLNESAFTSADEYDNTKHPVLIGNGGIERRKLSAVSRRDGLSTSTIRRIPLRQAR